MGLRTYNPPLSFETAVLSLKFPAGADNAHGYGHVGLCRMGCQEDCSGMHEYMVAPLLAAKAIPKRLNVLATVQGHPFHAARSTHF